MARIKAEHRVVILLHQGIRGHMGKTGLAYLRYGESNIVAVIDHDCVGVSLVKLTGINKDIPIVGSVEESLKYNPDVLLIGIAPSGGKLPESWSAEILLGLKAGLCLVNGLHTPMAGMVKELQPGQWIWDIRQEPRELRVGRGNGRSLSCQRILTVGTDMSVGKMSTSLELHRAAQKKGINSQFIATGQGGLMIAGEGIALDAVRVDFAAGAVEKIVMELGKDKELVIVEGQGSLLHPGSTATLPLIRGLQPTGLILVHRANQEHIYDLAEVKIPPLPEVIKLYEMVASVGGAKGKVEVKAVALNTFHLEESKAREACAKVEEETGLACTDVVRFGGEYLLEAINCVENSLT